MAESMETGVKKVHISSTAGQVPMQQMSQLTPQDKTLNGVTVTAGGATVFTASPIDMDGYSYLGIGGTTDLSHSWSLYAMPSPDGTNAFGDVFINRTGTNATKAGTGQSPLNYVLLQIVNNDAATRTYNIWSRKFN
jgi:hypothetical protein